MIFGTIPGSLSVGSTHFVSKSQINKNDIDARHVLFVNLLYISTPAG